MPAREASADSGRAGGWQGARSSPCSPLAAGQPGA